MVFLPSRHLMIAGFNRSGLNSALRVMLLSPPGPKLVTGFH